MSLNKVTLIGRLGKNPVAILTKTQNPMCGFSLATNERFKDGEGNPQHRTEWHDIVAFGGLAEVCLKHLAKGQKVYIEGRLRREKNGKGNLVTRVVADQLVMLGSAPAKQAVDQEKPF